MLNYHDFLLGAVLHGEHSSLCRALAPAPDSSAAVPAMPCAPPPSSQWLCRKRELLRGVYLSSWKYIICPLSRGLTQVTEDGCWCLGCCSTGLQRCEEHPAHPAGPQGSFPPSPKSRLSTRFAIRSQRIRVWLLTVKHLFQSEGLKGSFWLGRLAAGGTGCTQIFTRGSKGRH